MKRSVLVMQATAFAGSAGRRAADKVGGLVLLAAVLAGLGTSASTASAAVSGSSSGGAAPGGGGGQAGFTIAGGSQAEMLKFAECMRANGVPSFPDPNAQGAIHGSGIDLGSPQAQAAQKACQKDLPNGGAAPSPAQQAAAKAAALELSECMRSHGVPDFPDPTVGSGGTVGINIHAGASGGLNANSPIFQAAQKACRGIIGVPTLGPGAK